MVNLSGAQKELVTHSVSAGMAAADSEVAVRTLAEKQRELQKELNRLKGTRSKKIVQL